MGGTRALRAYHRWMSPERESPRLRCAGLIWKEEGGALQEAGAEVGPLVPTDELDVGERLVLHAAMRPASLRVTTRTAKPDAPGGVSPCGPALRRGAAGAAMYAAPDVPAAERGDGDLELLVLGHRVSHSQ